MATYSFSQGPIQSAYVQYQAYELTNDLPVLYLVWPSSYSDDPDVVANFMQITATPPDDTINGTIVIPDATQVSVGMNFFIYNTGSNTIIVQNETEEQIVAIETGDTYAFYLTDNSTPEGTWITFQFGAGVSNADATALAGEGLKAIGTTLNTTTNTISTGTLGTVITAQNRADLFVWTGGGGNAFVFPEAGAVGNGFYFSISNQGQGSITLTAPNALIDGGNVTALDPQISCYFITDGINWYTIGRGQPTYFSYFVGTIAVSAGNLILTENDANKTILKFIGELTANVTVFFPQIAYSWYMTNATTGPFTLSVVMTGSSSPPIQIPQSERMIFYSDNTNIYSTPTIILPEAGFIFPDGNANNPSIRFIGDNETGAFLSGQNMAITQNSNFVCDFSYNQANTTSIIRSPNSFGLAINNDTTKQFNFRSSNLWQSTLTAPSVYGPPPANNRPHFSIRPTSSATSLGSLRISPARLTTETFQNTTGVSISGVNDTTGNFSALGVFSNLINISTSGTNLPNTPIAPNSIYVYGDQLALTGTNSVGITTPTLGITSNATINGNLTVSGTINGSAAPVTWPLPVVLGGTGAAGKNLAFNNLSPLSTAGDLLSYSAGSNIRLPNALVNGKNLTSRIGQPPVWGGLSILQIQSTQGVNVNAGGEILGKLIPGFSLSITPIYSNSYILIFVSSTSFQTNQGNVSTSRFFINGDNPIAGDNYVFLTSQGGSDASPYYPCSFNYLYRPNSTLQQTFSFNLISDHGEFTNFGMLNGSIIAVEIGGN